MDKGIQTPMAQGRSTKIISMVERIRTSRLSIKNSLSGCVLGVDSRVHVHPTAWPDPEGPSVTKRNGKKGLKWKIRNEPKRKENWPLGDCRLGFAKPPNPNQATP